jgi:hypothetical protein
VQPALPARLIRGRLTEKAALQSSREALQFLGGVEAGRGVFNALWRALDRDEPDYRQ